MNAFVKKEIRLLLPGWLTVLVLVTVAPWVADDPEGAFILGAVALFFGMTMLGIASFGREFSQGTFSALLAQPMERRIIWRTKIGILFSATALILAVHFLNAELIRLSVPETVHWNLNLNSKIVADDFWRAMRASIAVTLVAITGGLWTALLLRQIAAAFWITFLTPLGLMMALMLFLPAKLVNNDDVFAPLLYSLSVLYALLGFWLAHRLFYSAQDAGWTGGVISFSNWRYLEQRSKNRVSRRQWHPWPALIKKEFQLHSVSLFCAGALLVLHLSMFFLRAFYADAHKDSMTYALSQGFWMFWLVMPLVIGCTTVAEERKLGMMDEQLCLPVSRRLEFLIKFIPTLIFGTFLGGVMPFALEAAAAWCGIPNEMLKHDNFANTNDIPGLIFFSFSIIVSSAGMAWVAFFASTVAKNFLQALSLAIVLVVGGSFSLSLLGHRPFLVNGLYSFGGIQAGVLLVTLIAILTTLVVLPWLCFRNFSQPVEPARLWRRNLLTIVGSIVFIFVSSAAIYNRVWEIFMPVEPAHGRPVLSLSNPPVLHIDSNGGTSIQLPDGRVWIDLLAFKPESSPWARVLLVPQPPHTAGPRQFMAGSNWVSVTINQFVHEMEINEQGFIFHTYTNGYEGSAGIQKDGSLWVSEKPNPPSLAADHLVRFGDETNWQQISWGLGGRMILLKKDGSLWSWGNHVSTNWPGFRAFQPRPMGTESNWIELDPQGWLAQKADGTVWEIWRSPHFQHDTNYDQIPLRRLSRTYFGDLSSYVRSDGSPWAMDEGYNRDQGEHFGKKQISTETNWVATAAAWNRIIGLKSDGTLWEWKMWRYPFNEPSGLQAVRLGIHNDWVAVAAIHMDNGYNAGIVTLDAHGGLWFWFDPELYPVSLLKLPKQPQFLGNIFD